jgi:hypothetical protein
MFGLVEKRQVYKESKAVCLEASIGITVLVLF